MMQEELQPPLGKRFAIEFGDEFENERVAMNRVRWLPEAEVDYEEGYEWYFEQSERAAEGWSALSTARSKRSPPFQRCIHTAAQAISL
jgi:hypothetical protein